MKKIIKIVSLVMATICIAVVFGSGCGKGENLTVENVQDYLSFSTSVNGQRTVGFYGKSAVIKPSIVLESASAIEGATFYNVEVEVEVSYYFKPYDSYGSASWQDWTSSTVVIEIDETGNGSIVVEKRGNPIAGVTLASDMYYVDVASNVTIKSVKGSVLIPETEN